MSPRRGRRRPGAADRAADREQLPALPAGLRRWIFAPQPIVRLELLRILVPLATLGFLSTRLLHADHWLSDLGFVVPDLGGSDWRQPLYLPPLPVWGAWLFAAVTTASGVLLAIGLATRPAAAVFAACLVYAALADRLAAFTVSKLAPILVVALLLSPCGARLGVDAWLARRRRPDVPAPRRVSSGSLVFFQVLLPVFYFSSGVCKARGDWLEHPSVLWTHLHDSYQTAVTHLVANLLPAWSFTLLQGITLAFECGAPLLFALAWTRPLALLIGLGMHLSIGLMFGPVIWFSLLMMSMLVAGYAPARWLERVLGMRAG
jgi:uncharacterized membrane protein YphA (DoxX/SURF4 family)